MHWLISFVCNTGALMLGVAGLALVAANYGRMPGIIPIHFGIDGKADGWGPRGMLWLLPILGFVLLGVFHVVTRKPLPRGEQVMVAAMQLEMMALFYVIERDQIKVALGERGKLSNAVWFWLLATMGTPVLALLLR